MREKNKDKIKELEKQIDALEKQRVSHCKAVNRDEKVDENMESIKHIDKQQRKLLEKIKGLR